MMKACSLTLIVLFANVNAVIEFLKFSSTDQDQATLKILLKSEVNYVDRLMGNMIEDFKSQINTVI